ncbi:MAG: ATP-binding cassette domain-containing protein, partial [Myxococcales bacterium]
MATDQPSSSRSAPASTKAPGDASGKPREHIQIKELKKSFGSNQVLKGINITVNRGETAVLIGGSGAGKTTLLRILMGLERPTSGQILIDGTDMAALNDRDMNTFRHKLGMVFQYSALLDSLTIFDNVAFPLVEHSKLSKSDMRDKVAGMLKTLGLVGKENLFPSELSGGQRKRVGLARALMLEPEVLIYDEPTSGLDPLTSRLVDDLIEETRQRFGTTNLVISHDMASTFRIAHRAFLLIQGKVVASALPPVSSPSGGPEATTLPWM